MAHFTAHAHAEAQWTCNRRRPLGSDYFKGRLSLTLSLKGKQEARQKQRRGDTRTVDNRPNSVLHLRPLKFDRTKAALMDASAR